MSSGSNGGDGAGSPPRQGPARPPHCGRSRHPSRTRGIGRTRRRRWFLWVLEVTSLFCSERWFPKEGSVPPPFCTPRWAKGQCHPGNVFFQDFGGSGRATEPLPSTYPGRSMGAGQGPPRASPPPVFPLSSHGSGMRLPGLPDFQMQGEEAFFPQPVTHFQR